MGDAGYSMNSAIALRREARWALCLSLAIGLVFGSATAALAARATSDWGYMTVDSIAYRNQAAVSDQSTFTRAYASTRNESRFQQVPTGYLGVRARLYKDSALCVQHSKYQFNDEPAWAFSAPKHGDCGSGVYNSRGLTAHWNSSQGQYNYYYTFWTPSINA